MTSSKHNQGPRQVPPPQGGAPRAANAYARFIPREELQDFANWTPDIFGGLGEDPALNPAAAARAAAFAQRTANEMPPAPPPPPPEPAGPTEAEWLERVQAARQQGWQDGHRDGLETLEAAKRQYAQQVSAQMAQLVAAFDDQIQALEARMASAVTDTAVTLARQVVRAELSQRPECVAQVAQEAVHAVMLSARHLRLRLHPQDMALVAEGASEALKAREVMLLADLQIQPGGCVVESDLGQVDARIESRWAKAAAVFSAPVAWGEPATEAPLPSLSETAE